MNWLYLIIGILSGMDALVGGYVFFKNPSKGLHRVFFVFSFGMAMIGIGMILLLETHQIIFDRMIFFGGYMMTVGAVLLSMKFPDDQSIDGKTWLIFTPLAVLAVLTPFGFLVKDVIFRADGILEPVNGPGIHVFAIVIGAYALLSIREFWRRYRVASGTARMQTQYLALGAGTFVAVTFVCNVLLPALGVFELNLMGPISSIFFVASVAYAIVRHELLDIRLVIQRGVIYGILLVLVAVIYIILLFGMNLLFLDGITDRNSLSLLAGIVTVCAGVFGVPAIDKYLRRLTDRIFFKDRYRYPQVLRQLSAILNRNMDTKKIIKRTTRALRSILRADEVRILILGVPSEVETLDSERMEWQSGYSGDLQALKAPVLMPGDRGVLVPVILDRKNIGVILVGPKLSGDMYRAEDLELLTTFSYQAGVALEKARLFEQVKAYSGNLEKKVKERTLELERLQEEQRQTMIDISHRLQTPLTVMKSELDLLKGQLDSPRHLETFERSVDGISKFIYDLLNLARIGNGQNGSLTEKMDWSELLSGLVEYFGVMAEDQKISLSARIEAGTMINGNRGYLEELAMNLVSNSFKYLEADRERKVDIILRTDNNQAIFEVLDTGRGIATEDLENLFERFYRGRQDSSGAPSGTGLGLAIAKKIVESHGGFMRVESERGVGTKVTVSLPCAEEEI